MSDDIKPRLRVPATAKKGEVVEIKTLITHPMESGQRKGEDGKVTLKAPEIAENGNAVPVTVSVESEMSEKSYVKAIYVAADGNPNPGVVTWEFTPLAGKAEVQFRARLAQTQKLVAVAEMNDGSLFTASREIKVTIGGCGG